MLKSMSSYQLRQTFSFFFLSQLVLMLSQNVTVGYNKLLHNRHMGSVFNGITVHIFICAVCVFVFAYAIGMYKKIDCLCLLNEMLLEILQTGVSTYFWTYIKHLTSQCECSDLRATALFRESCTVCLGGGGAEWCTQLCVTCIQTQKYNR